MQEHHCSRGNGVRTSISGSGSDGLTWYVLYTTAPLPLMFCPARRVSRSARRRQSLRASKSLARDLMLNTLAAGSKDKQTGHSL